MSDHWDHYAEILRDRLHEKVFADGDWPIEAMRTYLLADISVSLHRIADALDRDMSLVDQRYVPRGVGGSRTGVDRVPSV